MPAFSPTASGKAFYVFNCPVYKMLSSLQTTYETIAGIWFQICSYLVRRFEEKEGKMQRDIVIHHYPKNRLLSGTLLKYSGKSALFL
jgi:hypothetical protein